MSKSGKVLQTHKTHDNFPNKDGRQLQFTPEVTLIGAHIVSKLQPNLPIISKVIDNLVHSNFFQDHFLSRPLYTATSFKTISFQDHCVVNLVKIKPYSSSFQDHPFGPHLGHISISFKTIVPILHLSRPYLVLLSRPLHLV